MVAMKEMMKKETLDNVGNGYRLCILGNLNGWVGDGTRTGITGAFEVPGENDNDRRMVVFCVWITPTLSTEVCLNTQEWQGVKTEWR